MTNKFIFDVDGTLTPSRGRIDRKFASWFSRFCETHDVYLVTGSDRPKTIEQIGEVVYHHCKRVYNCSGNDVWSGDLHVRTSEWQLPELARYFLESCIYESGFPRRTGNHIEERPGMVNFSVVGRNADQLERADYVTWDTANNERNTIASAFNTMFPEIEARPGGETGIDIAPRGSNKSQILSDFDVDNDFIMFYGDRMDAGGNDFPLADALFRGWKGANYLVQDWQHTWDLLKETVDK